VTVPTLIVQGTVDGLFSLDESVTNYRLLRARDVPVKLLWYCGGHGVCLTAQGDIERTNRAVIQWLRRYVEGEAVATGARFDGIDQRGRAFGAADYPLPAGKSIAATGNGTLRLRAKGGSGPAEAPASTGGLGDVYAGVAPARARNAVGVTVRAPRRALVLGAPRLTLRYRGRAGRARPQRVFAQLVDRQSGTVLGNQVTPIALDLDGSTHTVTRPLETVAHRLKQGQRLTLQLVATTVAYARPQLGGRVRFASIRVRLPTAKE